MEGVSKKFESPIKVKMKSEDELTLINRYWRQEFPYFHSEMEFLFEKDLFIKEVLIKEGELYFVTQYPTYCLNLKWVDSIENEKELELIKLLYC